MSEELKTCVPIFCCQKSRDEALRLLKEKFPSVSLETNTGWTGDRGIEIMANEETIEIIKSFMVVNLSMIHDHFVCIN